LKAAHVGISVINDPELERKMDANYAQQEQKGEVVDKKVHATVIHAKRVLMFE
jgi:hypothetical protein